MFQKLNKILAYPAIWLIRLYQRTLSPDRGLPSLWLKGRICVHVPHCSEYSRLALKRYGFWPGIWYASDRVLHCTGGMNKIYDPDHYRVVFFSGAPIGVPFLQALANDKRFEIVGVVAQCDKPVGRGMDVCENIIKKEAKGLVTQPTKFLILHGRWGHGRENRFGRLKDTLEAQGHKVFSPDLPNAKHPHLQEQLDAVKQYVDQLDEHSIIIGHSLGCLLANHIITHYQKKVKAIINVAPASKNNDSVATQKALATAPELEAFVKQELDFVALRKYNDQHIIYLSDDDPYINFAYSKKYFAEQLPYAKIREFSGRGHFNEAAGATTLPEILEDIETILAQDFIITPTKINPEKSEEGKQFAEWLKQKKPDFLVVIAYGKIIPQAILDIAKIAPINVHGSLLPKYRGASPIQSCLLNDDAETGVTIMKMDAGMDTGDMIDTAKFKIKPDRTSQDIIEAMKKSGPKFLCDTLRNYGKRLLGEVKQDEQKVTLCGKIEKESGLIDPRKDSLHDVYCRYRAYYQWPKIYFSRKSESQKSTRIIIENIQIKKERLDDKKLTERNAPLLSEANQLNPALASISLKPEGKKAMSRKEFANGYMK